MINKIKLVVAAVAATTFLTANISNSAAQKPLAATKADSGKLEKLKAAVEASPDSSNVHEAYLKAAGIDNPKAIAQYEIWIKKYPKSAMVPYALAKAYLYQESPKAKPYLLKALAINPKFADAWAGLSEDAERWGDFKNGHEYLGKAAASDPSNPNYAFYYASSFDGIDETKWTQMSLEVAKRFPNSERGAQALYWLSAKSKHPADKIKYFELLRESFAPDKYNWSSSGMSSYYYLLLSENPEKAATLAQEMINIEKKESKQWSDMALQAQTFAKAESLINEKKGTEALAELKPLKKSRYPSINSKLELLRAKATDMAGNTKGAYDSLIVFFAKDPSVVIKKAITDYGSRLGKNAGQVDTDIMAGLNAVAQPATPFNGLNRYLTPGTAALSDFKGKVVLLTYWFPGCGPCRAEFPHFENVVKKFKGKDLEYLGINIASDQNEYVVPFMKGSGYSFTPLEDVKDRSKGNLDNRNAAPMNFLIDKEGRLIFAKFRTDADNEEDLELMINLLLNLNKA